MTAGRAAFIRPAERSPPGCHSGAIGQDRTRNPVLLIWRAGFRVPHLMRPRNDNGGAMERVYYVYILASARNGTLYIGVTNDLSKRIFDHRDGRGSLFTRKYKVTMLVYYEIFPDVRDAIAREKELKKWRRKWKLELIESMNADWDDLYLTLNR